MSKTISQKNQLRQLAFGSPKKDQTSSDEDKKGTEHTYKRNQLTAKA